MLYWEVFGTKQQTDFTFKLTSVAQKKNPDWQEEWKKRKWGVSWDFLCVTLWRREKEKKQKRGNSLWFDKCNTQLFTITSSRFGVFDVKGSGPGQMIVNGNMRPCGGMVCGGGRWLLKWFSWTQGSAQLSAVCVCVPAQLAFTCHLHWNNGNMD